MSMIPRYLRAIPDLPPIPGEWIQWQSMGKRGPGRWSNRHYTRNGRVALCGRKIPDKHRVFRVDDPGDLDVCPGCQRRVGPPPGKPLIDVL